MSDAATSVFELYDNGKTWERRALFIGSAVAIVGAGIAIGAAGATGDFHRFGVPAGIVIGASGVFAMAAASSSYEYRAAKAKSQAVTALEERARSEPAEPQLAWDLARIKLESYLDRNLRQVSSIFYLTVMVMLFGMALISFGVWQAIISPDAIQAPALAALAGVIIQIIGGTMLLIYRSTMAQAKDYVIVLERINAVGMSINILEGVEGASDMRDAARVQLSTTLLGMYAPATNAVGAKVKRKGNRGTS